MSIDMGAAEWSKLKHYRLAGDVEAAVRLRRSGFKYPDSRDLAEREELAWFHNNRAERPQPQEPSPMPEPAPAVNPKELRAAADGKAPLEYLEPALDKPLARVMEHGALKYGLRNYTDTPCKVRTYIGAALRHLHAIRLGDDIDPDSGESHWAHIAACCAVVLGAESAGKLVDDRTAFSTPLSDRVHQDGDRDAKGRGPTPAPTYHLFSNARAHYGKDVPLIYNTVKGWRPR